MGRKEEGERGGQGERWRAMEEGGSSGREGGMGGEAADPKTLIPSTSK